MTRVMKKGVLVLVCTGAGVGWAYLSRLMGSG